MATFALLTEVTRPFTGHRTVSDREQDRPVLTVEQVFVNLGFLVMPEDEVLKYKRMVEAAAYASHYRKPAPANLNVEHLGWSWYRGNYDLATRQFTTRLNATGGVVAREADPIFARMAGQLDQALRQVPGVEATHHVESFYTDPIGAVLIKQSGRPDRYIRYYAWDGNRTCWPPERKASRES